MSLKDTYTTPHTTTDNELPVAYRCVAYMAEIGAEVTETFIVADSSQQARDLFVADLGADKIKEGIKVEVFRAA